jgi:hypothetical protein
MHVSRKFEVLNVKSRVMCVLQRVPRISAWQSFVSLIQSFHIYRLQRQHTSIRNKETLLYELAFLRTYNEYIITSIRVYTSTSTSIMNQQDATRPNGFVWNYILVVYFLLTPLVKVEQCTETSSHEIQMPGNHPKETI